MGVARLLAKGWLVFCFFAGGHALHLALLRGVEPASTLQLVVAPTLLFMAMGFLFIGGFGASAGVSGTRFIERFRPDHLMPGFNETVFIAFAILSFANQIAFASENIDGPIAQALQGAIGFVIPGQRALARGLVPCGLDGGRVFASALTWILALIYLASTTSRLKLAAGLIRLDRARRPETLGPTTLAVILGICAVIGIQLFVMGSVYRFLPCSFYTDISGALLIGLAPLMLAYLIYAALAVLLASSPPK